MTRDDKRLQEITREELIEKATEFIWKTSILDERVRAELYADFHLEMMKLEEKTVCPKCSSEDNKIVTLYCNKCGEAY